MYAIIPAESNAALRLIAKEIPLADITAPHTQRLITEMKALLEKEEYGVALAAPQVGESLRLFVVSGKALVKRANSAKKRTPKDADGYTEDGEMPVIDEVYINPTLLKMSRGKQEKHEGCLSIRGQWGIVPRAEKATVRAYNEKGELVTRGASGFLAHIFQHEMDHLEGILYVDKANELYEDEHEHDA